MKARDWIVGRLEKAPRLPFKGETRKPLKPAPQLKRLERFLMKLRQNGATAVLLESGDSQGLKGILKLLKDEGVNRLLLTKELELFLGDGFREALGAFGILGSIAPREQEGLKRDALLADASVSVAGWGIAEVGAVVLVHGPENPRLLSLAIPLSLVVIRAEDVLDDLEGLTDKVPLSLDAASQVTLVSGPSQSADIQGVPFFGMHGPKKLIVAVLP